MDIIVETDREEDGRWIAEVPSLPGVLAYGNSPDHAVMVAKALALRVLADRLDHGEDVPELSGLFAVAA
ncbi:MAG: type II toxin-antitoxin system HicB family antitoxin [Armatimonadetes bacterium]|nr:type II toxin-antitoxin system HicB family antitoxin [Armatimonadota bacterium]